MVKYFSKIVGCLLLMLTIAVSAKAPIIPDNIVAAIKRGSVKPVKEYLNVYPDYINAALHETLGLTLLGLAAMEGQPKIVQELLKRGALPNITFNAQITPLMLVVSPYLAEEFATRLQGEYAWHAHHLKKKELNEKLAAAGRPHKEICEECQRAELMQNSVNNRLAIIDMLIQVGADVNAVDVDRDAVIKFAYNPDMFELLVRRGAKVDVKARDDDGNTILHRLANAHVPNQKSLALVLQLGADIEALNAIGLTPLQYVGNVDNTLYLIENGAAANVKDSAGKTLAHGLAAELDPELNPSPAYYATVEKILAKIDLNAQDNQGFTPLMVTTPSMIPLLLKYKANPLLKDKLGSTALHMYVTLPRLIFHVRAFLNSLDLKSPLGHAVLEARDDNGTTPLVWAAIRGNVDAVQELLWHGADIDALTNGSITIEDNIKFIMQTYENEIKELNAKEYAKKAKGSIEVKEREEKEINEKSELQDAQDMLDSWHNVMSALKSFRASKLPPPESKKVRTPVKGSKKT